MTHAYDKDSHTIVFKCTKAEDALIHMTQHSMEKAALLDYMEKAIKYYSMENEGRNGMPSVVLMVDGQKVTAVKSPGEVTIPKAKVEQTMPGVRRVSLDLDEEQLVKALAVYACYANNIELDPLKHDLHVRVGFIMALSDNNKQGQAVGGARIYCEVVDKNITKNNN